ncbi:GtrA family protein [Clostridiaceae bacterium AF42-6]|jgi:putative flippase GtrA|nr:GtrA family protein [Clostridiaceae bacterium]RGD94447.1 GtrA family protein [Clostridiales bacterium AM23-16LB]RHO81271.1 GtrA family protein [Clostridiaceae bacterium AF42-6]RHP53020.1 GtrA family protein [Clostridiaceae bacterium AF31-3BH]RHQ27101.1 GtrA family protein [Clostridiaceae bacterium AF29-16BH]RHR44513.1 GtrA family protein [Clostridiaceae bacterium AF18-31LB]RHT84221.1 GtrA family protein [Clostridiaceae bacterium AM27-36LB]
MKKLIEQMIKFGFVGFLCFFIDWGIMVFLTEVFGINPLISSTISFTVSVTVNYILSVTFVFETDKNANKGSQFVIFVLLSIVGLGVNELCMWLGTDLLGIHYMITKVGATAVVMVYNFITRKIFIEKK